MTSPFSDTSDCLTAAYGTKWNGNASAWNGSLFASSGGLVRRLTPSECESLQGFPTGWTAAPGSSDTARYRSLGNSMAVAAMRWVGGRIADGR